MRTLTWPKCAPGAGDEALVFSSCGASEYIDQAWRRTWDAARKSTGLMVKDGKTDKGRPRGWQPSESTAWNLNLERRKSRGFRTALGQFLP